MVSREKFERRVQWLEIVTAVAVVLVVILTVFAASCGWRIR